MVDLSTCNLGLIFPFAHQFQYFGSTPFHLLLLHRRAQLLRSSVSRLRCCCIYYLYQLLLNHSFIVYWSSNSIMAYLKQSSLQTVMQISVPVVRCTSQFKFFHESFREYFDKTFYIQVISTNLSMTQMNHLLQSHLLGFSRLTIISPSCICSIGISSSISSPFTNNIVREEIIKHVKKM